MLNTSRTRKLDGLSFTQAENNNYLSYDNVFFNAKNIIDVVKSLKVSGVTVKFNGEILKSKAELLRVLGGIKWHSRHTAQIKYNIGLDDYEKGFSVRVFASCAEFERSIYCRGGKNWAFYHGSENSFL